MESSGHSADRSTEAHPTEAHRPSCDGCRLRKLKCSREQPSCSSCTRLDVSCVYDDSRRNKPGLKRGTVDGLSRRLEILEHKLLDREQNRGSTLPLPADSENGHSITTDDASPGSSNVAALTSLAQEIQKLTSNISILSQSVVPSLRTAAPHPTVRNDCCNRYGKRQRLDGEQNHTGGLETDSSTSDEPSDFHSNLLVGDNLDDLLDAYFINVHPWIPMIHMATFRRKITVMEGKRDPPLILHAILVGALRFLDPTGQRLSRDRVEREIERSRNKVILVAMNSLTVENLQALIIVAFTHIGNGEPLKAWPIVGSLTRTVDFLQLSVEEQNTEVIGAFLGLQPLPPPVDWMQEEERRRVFWNIFILDRICSITTGWSIGLTADNVSRRLPICGTRWNEENPALAPFFGIWDKSAAKISKSVAFLPANYQSPYQSTEASGPEHDATIPSNPNQRPAIEAVDMPIMGAFAYYVEALESLCRINMYFLQQKIDFTNRQLVSSWLTRFKELDLRLVHWKMFLPPKWKDPSVPPKATTALDPNMTLAHIIHNTSMILLHQRIGYPEPELKNIKLPNFYSAETCQSASIETANITTKYLTYAPKHMPVSPHFSFCAYISARALLVHSRYYGVDLDSQFWVLVECLQQISNRWSCSQNQLPNISLSAQFARHLQRLHDRCRNDPNFSLAVVGPLDHHHLQESHKGQAGEICFQRSHDILESDHPLASTTDVATQPQVERFLESSSNGSVAIASGAMEPCRREHQLGEGGAMNWTSPSNGSSSTRGPDELSNILQTLAGQRFMEMDRVISFDDFNFEAMAHDLTDMPPSPTGDGWAPIQHGWTADAAPR